MGRLDTTNLLRRACRHDGPATMTALWSQINQVIRRFNDVQIMLDNHYAVAALHQSLQHLHQTMNIRRVQASSRLVQNIEGLACAAPRQLCRQFDPLRFASRQLCCRLSQLHIPQPYIL